MFFYQTQIFVFNNVFIFLTTRNESVEDFVCFMSDHLIQVVFVLLVEALTNIK